LFFLISSIRAQAFITHSIYPVSIARGSANSQSGRRKTKVLSKLLQSNAEKSGLAAAVGNSTLRAGSTFWKT
jgi:hypothetical protein